jgi:CrcB protein
MGGFPIPTLSVNVVGALIIGAVIGMAEKNAGMDPRLLLFLKVGICGGFTTFSTFSSETAQLLQDGKLAAASAYVLLSVLLCLAAVFAGRQIAA